MSSDQQEYVTPPCPYCAQTGTVTASRSGVMKWAQGALIQNALPELTPAQREQLITGFHPDCFEKAFPVCGVCQEEFGPEESQGEFVEPANGKHVLAHADCGLAAGMELA